MLVWFAISLAALLYIYALYPIALALLVRLRGATPVRKQSLTPTITVVVSAFNEAAVIARKLENTLALDYPTDRLRVVVVSDASTDGTDAIVRAVHDERVHLVRMARRRGKTAGLNHVLPTLETDLVVFTDANVMYERLALRQLAANFADPQVGCVTGETRYLESGRSAADTGERTYWSYETRIKALESALGSTVGGDGAIYAIRRALWRTLPDDAISDFLNPIQIVLSGWRAVFEPGAVCFEETAGATGIEYRRRVRIVSRSWRAVFQARGALNPMHGGLFTWCLVSHKVLRWFSGVFIAIAIATSARAGFSAAMAAPATAGATTLALVALAVAAPPLRRLTGIAIYFCVVYTASLVGIAKGSIGQVSGVWATPREGRLTPPGVR